MSQQKVYVHQQFPVSVVRLFEFLSIHENLDVLFAPVKSKLLKNGVATPYGVGSVRQMQSPLGSFQETITVSEPHKRIEYKVTQGSPIKNHHGVMVFEGDAQRSSLDYTIFFEGKFPLIGAMVRIGLQRTVSQGLAKLAAAKLDIKLM